MNVKKLIMYVIVAILVILVSIGFVKIFAFEKDPPKTAEVKYPTIDRELIDKLYSYIPEADEFERNTMYSNYYTKFQNLSYEVVQGIVYNYIIQHDEFKLLKATMDDLISNNVIKSYENKDDFKALYKINLSDFKNALSKVFGSESTVPFSSFSITNKLKAYYIENIGYLIYEYNNDYEINFKVLRSYDKYILTDDNNTIKIYDYYVKCDLSSRECYNDEKRKTINKFIINNDGVINFEDNLANAQEYVHTFKYENGHYYWFSSELAK